MYQYKPITTSEIMAVYREGYKALETIQRESKQIYSDACDFGALTKKGDHIWNAAKQLVDWYKVEGKREEHRYSTGRSCSAVVELMDEWAVSDERKTVDQATERYEVCFVGVKGGMKTRFGNYDGYIYVNKF